MIDKVFYRNKKNKIILNEFYKKWLNKMLRKKKYSLKNKISK